MYFQILVFLIINNLYLSEKTNESLDSRHFQWGQVTSSSDCFVNIFLPWVSSLRLFYRYSRSQFSFPRGATESTSLPMICWRGWLASGMMIGDLLGLRVSANQRQSRAGYPLSILGEENSRNACRHNSGLKKRFENYIFWLKINFNPYFNLQLLLSWKVELIVSKL